MENGHKTRKFNSSLEAYIRRHFIELNKSAYGKLYVKKCGLFKHSVMSCETRVLYTPHGDSMCEIRLLQQFTLVLTLDFFMVSHMVINHVLSQHAGSATLLNRCLFLNT